MVCLLPHTSSNFVLYICTVNNMTQVKIIAIDLDDTLLTESLSISDYTVDILRKVAQKGIYIVIASGRTDNAILPYVRRLELAGTQEGRYIISQNGAVIVDLHTRLPIYERFVDAQVLLYANSEAKKIGLYPEVYNESTIFVEKMNSWTELDMKLSGLKVSITPDFETLLQKGHPKMIIPGEPEVLSTLQATLQSVIGKSCVMFTSKPYFLEIMPLASGKGEALEHLCSILSIPREQTMAFGDSWNDESMMRYAYHSVCMKNGLDGIKKIASHVTEFTHNEDGLARFLEKQILMLESKNLDTRIKP